MKHYDRGRRNETVFAFLRANVRMAHKVLGDLNAEIAANNICADGVRKMIREYEFTDLSLLADTIIRLAGQSMRNAIRKLPNGIYRNTVSIPPIGRMKAPFQIVCAVEIHDETIVIDYEGSSPEVEAAINVTLPFTTSYTTYPIKVAIDPDVPNNAGCLEPITVKAAEGSVLNCRPPAPTWGRTILAHNLPEIVLGALAEAMPDRIIAACGSTPLTAMYFNGRLRNGDEFLSIVSHMGGFGGGPVRDGYSCLSFPYNTASIPVEVTEADTCLLYLKREFAPDTAGPGRNRGGFGQEIAFTIPDDERAPRNCSPLAARGSSGGGHEDGADGGEIAPAGEAAGRDN
jgi:N-methylhydantoinase B/oxoprolinase/acetone carboxylase alpha subunit